MGSGNTIVGHLAAMWSLPCPVHVTVAWPRHLGFPAPSSLITSPSSTVGMICERSRVNTTPRLCLWQVGYIQIFFPVSSRLFFCSASISFLCPHGKGFPVPLRPEATVTSSSYPLTARFLHMESQSGPSQVNVHNLKICFSIWCFNELGLTPDLLLARYEQLLLLRWIWKSPAIKDRRASRYLTDIRVWFL